MDVQHGRGLSPFGPARERERRARQRGWLLHGVRYGLPLAILIAGLAILLVEPDRGTAVESSFMFFGVAIAVLLLNLFFRIGVSGEHDRDAEEDARRYFDRHGRWPDDA